MKRVTQHTVKMTKALYEALGTLDLQKGSAVMDSRQYRI